MWGGERALRVTFKNRTGQGHYLRSKVLLCLKQVVLILIFLIAITRSVLAFHRLREQDWTNFFLSDFSLKHITFVKCTCMFDVHIFRQLAKKRTTEYYFNKINFFFNHCSWEEKPWCSIWNGKKGSEEVFFFVNCFVVL